MINTDLVITYLANIVKIAQLDGKLHPGEQDAIGRICKDIQAEESQLTQALKKVAEDGHQMTPVGRFSDKIRNLEDMLLVAMIDGDLTQSEKSEMLAFVRKINLTKDQIKSIMAETKLKISLRQTNENCTQCGAVLTPDSKFCTACGQKVGP